MTNKNFFNAPANGKEIEYVLGLSYGYHDSAAALIYNGEIIAAAQEERFSRIKGDSSFPKKSIEYVLSRSGINPTQLSAVIYYESPYLKFNRILSTLMLGNLTSLPLFIRSMTTWLPEKLWVERDIKKFLGRKTKVIFLDHHLSHAASAFYPSGFNEAAILTIDGVGEWSSTTIAKGSGNKIAFIKQIEYPNSLGMLYSAFTLYCGFKINSGEYKLMGLAPFGEPIFKDMILEKMLTINADGSYILNSEYFAYFKKYKTLSPKFAELFKEKSRNPNAKLTKFYADVAASIQAVTNQAVLKLAEEAKRVTNSNHLVLAGGVALNVVAIGELERSGIFDDIFVQPAAGDAGGALGAALEGYYRLSNANRNVGKSDDMHGAFLGPEAKVDEIFLDLLSKSKVEFKHLNDEELAASIGQALAEGKIVGIARGSMEYGPRALGARSILAPATDETMQLRLNLKTKFREGFRPFAPMVLKEYAENYFEMDGKESPYMLKTYPIKDELKIFPPNPQEDIFKRVQERRSKIPAVTHIDYSARVQTIDRERNPFIYKVLMEYYLLSGVALIVNTSFNVRGEPIINTAQEALEGFLSMDIDILVVGNYFIKKTENTALKSINKKVKND